MTVTELKKRIVDALTPVVGVSEATAMMREMFLKLKGYSAVDIVVNGNRDVLPQSVANADAWVSRVVAGEPLQYVLGTAHFMGMELKVTPAVLIPRPETSQLVDMITDAAGSVSDLAVLDVGTGSGCIAIALSRALTFPRVTAIDISDDALGVARDNAAALHARVDFRHADALALARAALPAPFNIIVSNPPYIAASEKATMDARVYAHEPERALFVSDANPLLFYSAIAAYAASALAPGGALYFEINPLFAVDLQKMLAENGWRDVELLRDYKGAYRFAVCRR